MAKKIQSPEQLKLLRDRFKSETELRTGPKDIQITVHMGTCGIAAGAREVLTQLADELTRTSLENVTLRQSGCLGMCDKEPMLTLTDNSGREFHYANLDKDKVHKIISEHVAGGKPVKDYIIT